MNYEVFILTVNVSAIVVMLLLALLLLSASRFKGQNGYAAAIIVITTIPVYIYNVCRSEQWYGAALWLSVLSFSVNTTLMPLLWLFVRRNFNPAFSLRKIHLLHFIPFVACFALMAGYILSTPAANRYDFMICENQGQDNWIGQINSLVIFGQMFVYFTLIFIFLHRVKKYIDDNCSQAEYLSKRWIPRFMALMAALFAVVFVAYSFWPRTDAWLIQILNVAAMSYLTHNALAESRRNQQPTPSIELNTMSVEFAASQPSRQEMTQLEEYAETIESYLRTSKAFVNPDLTLQDLSRATGISSKNISRSINTTFNKSFFELINQMRIELAKPLLKEKIALNLTIDAIAGQCGFNSRVTFCNAFKRCEGMTTTQWLRSEQGKQERESRL